MQIVQLYNVSFIQVYKLYKIVKNTSKSFHICYNEIVETICYKFRNISRSQVNVRIFGKISEICTAEFIGANLKSGKEGSYL